MVKKLVLSLVIVVLVIGLALSGCAQQAPAPTTAAQPKPSPTPASAPTTTTPVSPTTLRFSTYTPEARPIGNVFKAWAQRISDQSGGKIQIKPYFSSALLPQADTIRGLQTGMGDIAYYNIGTNQGLLPLMELARLPFIGLPSMKAGAEIMRQVVKNFPEMEQEIQGKGLKYLAITAFPPEQFMFTKKVIKVPADLKGMKIIGRGYWPQVLDGTGAACLNLNMEDWYTSLERGLAEGHVINFLGAQTYKTLELLKYHTILGGAGGSMVTGTLTMNLSVFNSFPPDLQKVLLDNCKWFEDEQLKLNEGDENDGINAAKAANHTFVNLTPDEVQQWSSLAKPLHQKYMTDNASAGPIKAIYDGIQTLIKQSR